MDSLPGSDGDLMMGQGMLKADFAFNEQVALSAFAQYNSEESILLGRGTFKGFEDDLDIFVPGSDSAWYQQADFGIPENVLDTLGIITSGEMVKVADTSGTTEASDSGQWGIRLTFEPESMPDTQFAVYYSNYHSSLPYTESELDGATLTEGYVNAITSTDPSVQAVVGSSPFAAGLLAGMYGLSNGTEARTVYPEDIKLWGASFHTRVFGYTQIAGEITYAENMPIWIDHPDDNIALMLDGVGGLLQGEAVSISLADSSRTIATDKWYQNFIRTPVWDASLSVIQPLGAVLGTDLLYVVGETAFEQVSGLENYDLYTAKGAEAWAGKPAEESADDRLDRFSWGYNLLVGANWNDVVTPGLNLESTVRFTHDVEGNSHRTGRFEEGEKRMRLGLSANYDDLSASIQWGGKADNFLRKGVITAHVGYNF